MTQELNSCPFCGSSYVALIPPTYAGDSWIVMCDNHEACPTPSAMFDSEEKAIKAWNARAPLPEPSEDALEAENVRLREALRFYADKHSWRTVTAFACGHSEPHKVERDGGKIARTALGETQ